ncbi:5-formyltetrahydrofolate cyclo-ligase [Bacillus sp. ISL-18]|uniref:5-formyltetrahydrofolate cyclo-ligase n=1 Tax=Bacillus sp. ISL-18 TaxID=2819118 RepID=UPI001BE7A4DE|nr:5-formyltetrahydrofolate cyclo-ligase [Bacillus sp. ISL-18]MBT2656656.1 5-formyltetrahydrofolate cyclo-ligase [Bacillus sp. ISL-18]
MSGKDELRKQVKEILSNLPRPVYEDYSYKIAQTLFAADDWINAKVIGIYVSRQPEVDTYQIIRKAWEQEKLVVVPKCNPTDKNLSFRILTEFAQLESVYFGLFEPIVALTDEMNEEMIDLLIVPGLAYTRTGHRLGFGGGYYDRFLSHYTGQTISLAFDQQIIPQFPIEEYDIPVSKIITNHEVITTK